MWKTQHVVMIAVGVTILSVTLTLYIQSQGFQLIISKSNDTDQIQSKSNSDPIGLMSAMSSTTINPDDQSKTPVPPPSVSFAEKAQVEPPKGSGTRWTPL